MMIEIHLPFAFSNLRRDEAIHPPFLSPDATRGIYPGALALHISISIFRFNFILRGRMSGWNWRWDFSRRKRTRFTGIIVRVIIGRVIIVRIEGGSTCSPHSISSKLFIPILSMHSKGKRPSKRQRGGVVPFHIRIRTKCEREYPTRTGISQARRRASFPNRDRTH